ARPPTVQEMFGDAREGIGTESPEKLPPVPGEPHTGPAANAGRGFKRAVARIVEGITRRLPHLGRRRTWVNDLEDWARAQLHAVQEQVEHSRSKELQRLLHLLQNDPEAGLRHAIPMNTFAHRGLSAPGGKLKERNPDFDPRRLGGTAADFWSVPLDLQEQ